jgi:2-methylisocitrate lyase-like PEP mutase family enzyme
MRSLSKPAERLRALLAGPDLLVMPCCYDGLSAKLIAQAGAKLSFMSGFSVSATRLGLPDTGLISFAEMADSLRQCCAAAPDMPIIGDGDTGHGNALNVQRTVVEYARAGAAAVMIEDQVSPKRCGHTKGKQVIARAEARMKIRAAVEAAREVGILVMARTDARAVAGFDEAMARCRDFVAEGADMIFLEAPESVAEMRAFCAGIDRPTMANMIEGGKTPVLPQAELRAIGYKIAAYPLALLAALITATRQASAALLDGAPPPPRASFEEVVRAAGFHDYWAQEERYRAED